MSESPTPSRLAASPSAALRLGAARDLEASSDALLRLALDDNLWVRRRAAAHPAFPAEELALLRRAGSSADLSSFAPPDPTLPPEVLERLVDGGVWGQRLAARHPATPPATLIALAGHPSASLRADLATHPHSPPELLARLLADSDAGVRQAALARAPSSPAPAGALALLLAAGAAPDLAAVGVPLRPLATGERAALSRLGPFARQLAAGLPDLTEEEITRLVEDADAATRAALAANTGCPAATLLRLAEDDDLSVQQAVLGNPRAPAAALLLLAADEDDSEKLSAIARHPAAPAGLLARLAEHGAGRVREAAAAHPSFPAAHDELLRRAGAGDTLTTLGEPDPGLAGSELARLARSGAWGRLLAARHPATSTDDLARLATDADLLVRQAAARNPRLPGQVLELLLSAGSARELDGYEPAAADPHLAAPDLERLAALGPWGRRLAARHPACPAALLVTLAGDADPQTRTAVAVHEAAGENVLAGLARDASPAVRWVVVKRPDLAAAALVMLSRDPLATIRTAVATHPAVPGEVLETLARDPDEDVRAEAHLRAPLRM